MNRDRAGRCSASAPAGGASVRLIIISGAGFAAALSTPAISRGSRTTQARCRTRRKTEFSSAEVSRSPSGKSVDGEVQQILAFRRLLSGDLQRRNFLDRLSEFLLRVMQIVPLLQIEPEIRTISAQLPEPQCHGRGDRLLFRENIIKRLTRHAEQLGDLRLGPIKRRQNLLAKKFAGMHGWQAALRELSGHESVLSDSLPDRRRPHRLRSNRTSCAYTLRRVATCDFNPASDQTPAAAPGSSAYWHSRHRP